MDDSGAMGMNFIPYQYALIRGRIVPIKDANISIMTNALHYGTGIFAGIKAYEIDGQVVIFRLDDHLERLKNSCKILRFPFEFDTEIIKQNIIKLAQQNNLKATTYIRPLIYRSDTNMSPGIAGEYDLAVYMLDMPSYFTSDKGLAVQVSSWQRNNDNSLPPRTKASGGYLNSSLAIHDAQQSGFDTAIMLDSNGNVGEGAMMNLFIVKDGMLITPSKDSDILEGITRRTVIEIAFKLNIPIMQRIVQRTELYTADELFFSGTAVNIHWVKSIDNVAISSEEGSTTKAIRQQFEDLFSTRPHLFTKI